MIFSLAKKKTLIVEDFAEFARSVRAMLHPMGATQVDIVNSAEDAIEACKAKKYDIILSDYNLGAKKDGQQLLEELNRYQLIKSNCVFLMLTAENTAAMVMGAVEYIPDSYIAKPFNGNLLKSRLQKAIERKDALTSVNRAMRNKQWKAALDEIEIIIVSQPKYKMSCLRSKIISLTRIGNLDQALKLATEVVSARAIPWALESIGEIYYLKNEYEKSMDIFRNQIQEFPMSIGAYDWLAKLQSITGQPIAAQETITKALERSPKALHRQKLLGELAEENNDLLIMTKAYRNAIKYGENSAFAAPDEYIKLAKAYSKQAKQDPDSVTEQNVKEVERTFTSLNKKFSTGTSGAIRSDIAKADFMSAIGNNESASQLLTHAKELYANLDEELTADICLEISDSLNEIGENDFSETIMNIALQQNFDDPSFIERAAKISQNKDLVEQLTKVGKTNATAIALFKKENYKEASLCFEKAYQAAPKNINITLNYAQSLLKQSQNTSRAVELVKQADEMLAKMPQLTLNDNRGNRYNELKRLSMLMLQKLS